MYLVPLENCAQCRATQQVFYKLFTFKTFPNLQLKCTLYVVHFLPVLDFRAALNPSQDENNHTKSNVNPVAREACSSADTIEGFRAALKSSTGRK
jgi:hypothetical protein